MERPSQATRVQKTSSTGQPCLMSNNDKRGVTMACCYLINDVLMMMHCYWLSPKSDELTNNLNTSTGHCWPDIDHCGSAAALWETWSHRDVSCSHKPSTSHLTGRWNKGFSLSSVSHVPTVPSLLLGTLVLGKQSSEVWLALWPQMQLTHGAVTAARLLTNERGELCNCVSIFVWGK